MTHVMNWVKVHYPEPLSLETAADSLALSKEYFCRLFKKYTGQTFLEYLNDVRTMHLYEDLQNSDETITVLMEKNGLSNYKIFMRTLQKAVWLYTSENALEPDTARINSFETYCSYTH